MVANAHGGWHFRRRPLTLALALVVAAFGVGCEDDSTGSEAATASASPTEEESRTVYSGELTTDLCPDEGDMETLPRDDVLDYGRTADTDELASKSHEELGALYCEYAVSEYYDHSLVPSPVSETVELVIRVSVVPDAPDERDSIWESQSVFTSPDASFSWDAAINDQLDAADYFSSWEYVRFLDGGESNGEEVCVSECGNAGYENLERTLRFSTELVLHESNLYVWVQLLHLSQDEDFDYVEAQVEILAEVVPLIVDDLPTTES